MKYRAHVNGQLGRIRRSLTAALRECQVGKVWGTR